MKNVPIFELCYVYPAQACPYRGAMCNTYLVSVMVPSNTLTKQWALA